MRPSGVPFVAIGFLATAEAPDGVDGLFYGGGVDLVGRQVVGAGAVLIYSFAVTYAIGWLLQRTIGFRVDSHHEAVGVDRIHHGESGYEIDQVRIDEEVVARVSSAP